MEHITPNHRPRCWPHLSIRAAGGAEEMPRQQCASNNMIEVFKVGLWGVSTDIGEYERADMLLLMVKHYFKHH